MVTNCIAVEALGIGDLIPICKPVSLAKMECQKITWQHQVVEIVDAVSLHYKVLVLSGCIWYIIIDTRPIIRCHKVELVTVVHPLIEEIGVQCEFRWSIDVVKVCYLYHWLTRVEFFYRIMDSVILVKSMTVLITPTASTHRYLD